MTAAQKALVIDRIGIAVGALILLVLGLQAVQDPVTFMNQTMIGITNGTLIALVALGYTMVYGIIELINFAHGDVFMWGSMVGMQLLLWSGAGPEMPLMIRMALVFAAIFTAMIFCGGMNVIIERIAYKPLRNAPPLAPLITAIGMSFILGNLAQKVWGPSQRNVPDLLSNAAIIGSFRVKDLFVISVTVPLLIGLTWFIKNSKQGKAMRATAQDKAAAAIMGIDVNRTIAITFLIGGLLAGASGVLYALFNTTTVWNAGFRNGMFAFTAAVLGGIGNLTGAVLGGLLLGLVAAYADHYISLQWTEVMIFSILILTLVFRPTGLLGESTVTRA